MTNSTNGEVDYKASYFECLKERDVSRRDYEVMYKFHKAAEDREAIIFEWMKNDKTGDSDYPTTFDCFAADHPEIISETGE